MHNLLVDDALPNILGGRHQESVASYSTTVDHARFNVSHIIRSYCQNGPISLTEAVKPFALDMELEIDRSCDLLKQMLRRYKHPSFDIIRPLCVEFKDELRFDAGRVTRTFPSVDGEAEEPNRSCS